MGHFEKQYPFHAPHEQNKDEQIKTIDNKSCLTNKQKNIYSLKKSKLNSEMEKI